MRHNAGRHSCYRPHSKDGEGNVLHVCMFGGGGRALPPGLVPGLFLRLPYGLWSQVLPGGGGGGGSPSPVIGPVPGLAWNGGTPFLDGVPPGQERGCLP